MGDLSEFDSDLGARLVADGHLSAANRSRAEALAYSAGITLDRAVTRLGLIEERTVLGVVAEARGLPVVEEAARLEPSRTLAEKLGTAYLRRNVIVPVTSADEGRVTLLTADPGNAALIREVEFQLEMPVTVAVAASRAILRLIGTLDEGAETTGGRGLSAEQERRDRIAYDEAALEGPVIRFVSRMLNEAVAQGASDVHFASTDSGLDVRYRMNGVLVRQAVDAALDPSSVFARLKVMAGMNVAERRKPQDGRIANVIGGRVVDFRVSSLPTQLGESIVARVLDPMALRLGWDALGFDADTAARIRRMVERPAGLFLVTGATGSGKTTTLYTALDHLRSERRKIITIEDPVEYQLPDVEQIQVQEEIGLTFASALRSVLRQDPNVIMVGEIRDSETAAIACRAAMVGRMVLSTLHTATPAGAVARLVDLGVDRFIVEDVLTGVMGQELEILHCPDCGGAGCEACGVSGTVGRRLRAEIVEGTGRA